MEILKYGEIRSPVTLVLPVKAPAPEVVKKGEVRTEPEGAIDGGTAPAVA